MNWEAIGAVGEILGAVAVVGSLVYLASQIRTQNREARVASVHELIGAYLSVTALLNEPEMADTWIEGIDHFDELSPSKRLRFTIYLTSALKVFEDAYFQWSENRLETEAWESLLAPLVDVMATNGAQKVWDLRKHYFRKDFVAYIDRIEKGGYSF